MKPHTQKFLQQRRFYMFLPLLVTPFVTMIFWALGGGQGVTAQAQPVQSGLNTELPGAHFDKEDELWDKFALYERAKRDSLKYEEARRNDPYYVTATLVAAQDTTITTDKLNTSLGAKDKYAPMAENEHLINRKLAQLSRHLEGEPSKPESPTASTTSSAINETSDTMSPDVDRLEKMMQIMASSDTNDPEMQQIDGMLDKILDIQHPQRMRDKINNDRMTTAGNTYSVVPAKATDNINSMGNTDERPTQPMSMLDSLESAFAAYTAQLQTNGFYGLSDEVETKKESSNAFPAVIHDTQVIVSGSIVKLRLLSDIVINDQLIHANEFVFGVCTINGERLSININSIRDGNSLLPVALSAYDLDGMEGIYIPGAISRDVAKQAGSQSIQDVQLYSMDNSLEVQAATAGIEAAKGIFSKKTKLIKVTVKAGYQVLLQDTSQQSQAGTISHSSDSVQPDLNF